jgi:predicted dehydrogenase
MSHQKTRKVGIILNGVTGRMGTNQHLLRSIAAFRDEGGLPLGDGSVIVPDPILVGRNPAKLTRIAESSGFEKWTTHLDEALEDDGYTVYFDAQTTTRRVEAVHRAIDAGKNIYCEKPTALTTQEAYKLYLHAQASGVKHGVVQDKLWLPGIRKLMVLRDTGFFGDILSVRGEFGYWVFEGDTVSAQRPSWNYRKEDGGGIITDMLCHWRYVLDNVFGPVKAVTCLGATHIPERVDESGNRYTCTADDAAYATFRLEGGIIAHFNSSWVTRVRRDDLLTIQVDGSRGSAVAGLRDCWVQPYGATPKPVWNPDLPNPIDFHRGWQLVPDQEKYDNAFKAQWALFLKHLVAGEEYKYDLLEGAKGVQLAELGLASWESGAWVDVPPLEAVEPVPGG